MSDVTRVVIIVFSLWILQFVLTYFQLMNFKKRVRALRHKGKVLVGQAKGKLKEGSIVLVVVDDERVVIDAEEMRGITVFNKFRKLNSIVGRSVDNQETLLEGLKNKQQKKAILQALEGGNE